MLLLSGADIVLPDRVLASGTLAIDGDRIAEVTPGARPASGSDTVVDLQRHTIVPGFIDVHVHGVEGIDTLDGADAVRRIARRLPRFGVTAFCPTSIACTPAALAEMLTDVREARVAHEPSAARVLPAHLESNFINPEYNGAQPRECLRLPPGRGSTSEGSRADSGEFTGQAIVDVIGAARPDVGIVTLAPELPGALDLIRELIAAGHDVSLGHSGATYEEALAGIAAGARQATHLFNRMSPLGHRAPGLTGAVLGHDEVTAELICDGVHVHPAVIRTAIAAKSPGRIMAITDGTAGAGLPQGARAAIGGRPITVAAGARLDDGTLAGSVLTMDQAFRLLVTGVGLAIVEASVVCSTTPARALSLHGFGAIAPGAAADLVMLDDRLHVAQTWIGGTAVWSAKTAASGTGSPASPSIQL